MTTPAARTKAYDRLYATAKTNATNAMGGAQAFRIIGATLRHALVATEILYIADLQDEIVSAERVRDIVRELRTRLNADEALH